MSLLNKLAVASFMSVALLATAPTAIAKPAGKIENATGEETVVAIAETLELAGETLAAIQNDSDKDSVMGLFKKTKQRAKTIESTTTYMLREKALGKLGKARLAYKKGKEEKAAVIAKMEKALDGFKAIKERYENF